MKNKYAFSFVCLFLFIFMPSLSVCGQNLKNFAIGTVDFNAIVLLHPKMIDYEPQNSSFKVLRVKGNSNFIKEQKEKINNELKQLEFEKELIGQQLIECRNQFEEGLMQLEKDLATTLEGKIASGTRKNAEAKFEIKSAELSRKTEMKKANLYSQLGNVQKRLSQLKKMPGIENHTTASETEKMLTDIIDEAKSFVKLIADKNGIFVVLNSSYERNLNIKSKENNHREPPNVSLKDILYAKYVPTYDNSHENYNSKYYNDIYSNARKWMRSEESVLGSNYDMLPKTNVIIGGKDITNDVLLYMFKKYKINNNVANAIIKSIYQ